MMLDDLSFHEAAGPSPARPAVPTTGETVAPNRAVPMADREVAVPIELARTPDLVHAWLDGEAPAASVRGPEWARHVEFWSRVDGEIESQRQVHAPADLTARIMAALPEAGPLVATPWWSRTVAMNPLAIAAAAAGLLALGAAIGATLR